MIGRLRAKPGELPWGETLVHQVRNQSTMASNSINVQNKPPKPWRQSHVQRQAAQQLITTAPQNPKHQASSMATAMQADGFPMAFPMFPTEVADATAPISARRCSVLQRLKDESEC